MAFQEKTILHDVIINVFMNNPDLYDKSENEYHYTLEKIKKLKDLSLFLKEVNVDVTVPQIIEEWKKLVAEFKKCHSEDTYAASGSGSKTHDFIYYENMRFLKNVDKHRQPLSTKLSIQNASGFVSQTAENTITLDVPKTTALQMQYMPQSIKSPSGYQSVIAPQFLGASKSQVKNVPYNLPSSSQSSNKSSMQFKPLSRPFVPEYDKFANKKLKVAENDEDGLKQLNKKMIVTLDSLQKKINNEQCQKNDNDMNYTNILTQALSKVQEGMEDDCLQYVMQELEQFNLLFTVENNPKTQDQE